MSNFRTKFKAFAVTLNQWSERMEQLAVDRPVTLSFCIALAVAIIVVGLSWHYWSTDSNDFLENVAVEAHGMIFDLFVIGWFVLWLNKRAEKRLDIRRYQEEIDDYRGWREAEAAHRILGCVRRLNKNGVTQVNLSRCFLDQSHLEGINLTGSNLSMTDFSLSQLNEAKFSQIEGEGVQFCCTDLSSANFRGSNLRGANFSDAELNNADLTGTDLSFANFNEAKMKGCNLTDAVLDMTRFENTDLSEVIGLTEAQLATAWLCQTKLPEYIKNVDPDRQCGQLPPLLPLNL